MGCILLHPHVLDFLWFFIHFWTWAPGFAPSKALGGGHSEAEGRQEYSKNLYTRTSNFEPLSCQTELPGLQTFICKDLFIERRNHIRKWIMALWRIWVFVTYILVGYITKLGGRVQLTFLIFCDCSRSWNNSSWWMIKISQHNRMYANF